MEKQIFKNIVSEETLKEAYDHHSYLRQVMLKAYATKEHFDIMIGDFEAAGFDWWDQLHKKMMDVAGVSKPWQLSAESRTEVICKLCDYYDLTAPMYKKTIDNQQPTTKRKTQ